MKVINDGFKMWSNYLEAIDSYTGGDDEKFGRFMRILCYYGIYGEEIAKTDIEKLFFTGVKSSINASIQNIKNGMLGGRGKTNATVEDTKSFKKPTLEEIKAYCEEKHSNIDPQAFFDYYNKIGWVYGKNKLPIKDWKACVSTWERNNKKYGNENVLHSTSSEVL
jgi:hypothetical protein